MKVEIYVNTGAHTTKMDGYHDGRIKIKLAAKPVKGEANKELINFLSQKLNINKTSITILYGEKNRNKCLNIDRDITRGEFVKLIS